MSTCQWWCSNALCQTYHDTLWGVPVHQDRQHFKALSLELLQAGLNWAVILKKEPIFESCFAGFDFRQVARFTDRDVEQILATEGMIRSRRKIEAIIGNARCFLKIIRQFGSFDRYIWSFTEGDTLIYPSHQKEPVSKNELSDRVCKDLKAKGFRFLGSVTVYSYLQACGIINDHAFDCPRFRAIAAMSKSRPVP